jgi:hypothetical protein
VKLWPTLVCVIVGCVCLSPAQNLPPRSGDSVNVQRLLKFSGTLTDPLRQSIGSAALHFAIYNQPYGGAAYWQETQNVHPDAQGHYTVLLGETTPGGLPPEILASGGAHWLAVEASGQPEQSRILLVELPAASQSHPTNSSASESESATPSSDYYIAAILSIMFLAGLWMTYVDTRKRWKTQTEQGEPPFANLLTLISSLLTLISSLIPSRERIQCVTQTVSIASSNRFRALRGRLQRSLHNVADDQPKKAA